MNAMSDDGLAARQAKRIPERGVAKPPADRDVTERVVGRPRARATPADTRSIRAVPEVDPAEERDSQRDSQRAELQAGRGWNVAGRMEAIDHLFGVIYVLMSARLLLALVGADPSGSIVRFVTAQTDPLYAPFRSLVGIPATEGGETLALPILTALVGYMLVHASISGLVRATRQRSSVR